MFLISGCAQGFAIEKVFIEVVKKFVVDFCIFKSTETRLLIVVVSLIPPATLTNNKYMCIVRSQKQLDQWPMNTLSRFYAIFQI